MRTALLVLALLSLVLPFILSGDKTLTTFISYTILTSLTIAFAQAYLRRWAKT